MLAPHPDQVIRNEVQSVVAEALLMISRSLDIERIEPTLPEDIALLEEFRKTYNPEQQALFILQGTTKDFIIVSLNMKSYEVAGYLALDPWEVYKFSPNN